MTTGSSADIVARVKKLIPNGWFLWVAPLRDALLGGIADSAAWCYNLITYARAQARISTASGIFLDIVAYDYLGTTLTRNGLGDTSFRAVIRARILQERVTRAGMINALTALTGIAPAVFEPWNTFDTGAYSGPASSGAKQYGQFGYGVGRGGYGNMNLPGQAFVTVYNGLGAGIPNVDGYGNPIGGYGVGQIEYGGPQIEQSGITAAMIYSLIDLTKPTGSTVWTNIASTPGQSILTPPPKLLDFNTPVDSPNLAVI